MENTSTNGVLTHLSLLEVRALSRGGPEPQRSRVRELRGEAEELRGVRDQLEAEIRARKIYVKRPEPGAEPGPDGPELPEPAEQEAADGRAAGGTGADVPAGQTGFQLCSSLNVPTVLQNPGFRTLTPPSSSGGAAVANICFCQRLQELRSSADPPAGELLPLMRRHSDLKQRLHVHHLIGGFDAVRTRQGRAVCVFVQTAYEGVFLETFNMELELKPRVQIGRHNIPPFIPLQSLAEQSHLQTDAGAFLSMLSQHLNAFVGRRRQLQLVQEQHRSVEVMESNLLCSVLVLLFTAPPEKTALLCTLKYADLGSCLPGQVHLDCEDSRLPESPEWRSCCDTLRKTPLHRALAGMKKSRMIL